MAREINDSLDVCVCVRSSRGPLVKFEDFHSAGIGVGETARAGVKFYFVITRVCSRDVCVCG